jgi:hypothetical protein
VGDDVRELVRAQAIVDGHEDGADLGHGVKRLELCMRIRRDVRDAIAGLDAERLQRHRPPIATIEELRVGEPQVAVHDRFTVWVQSACASGEVERGEGYFHDIADC